MIRSAWPIVVILGLVMGGGAAPAAAADKAHQQLMAEIRMLQEQQQQLQQVVGGLVEALKAVSAKIDDQSGANRKAFADQKLLIDNVAEGVRILREKADDTNVRLSSVSQELEGLRQAFSTMPSGSPGMGTRPMSGGATESGPPAGAPAGAPSPAPTGAPPLVSAQKLFDNAFSDYTAGQYDIAIQGFKTYIATFPKSDQADDAQLNIGNSLYAAGKFREAA